jgi:hypothetical protein
MGVIYVPSALGSLEIQCCLRQKRFVSWFSSFVFSLVCNGGRYSLGLEGHSPTIQYRLKIPCGDQWTGS